MYEPSQLKLERLNSVDERTRWGSAIVTGGTRSCLIIEPTRLLIVTTSAGMRGENRPQGLSCEHAYAARGPSSSIGKYLLSRMLTQGSGSARSRTQR